MQRVAGINNFIEREVQTMKTQTYQFAVSKSKGKVVTIGCSAILMPKPNYSGKGTKWYEDKPKQKNN